MDLSSDLISQFVKITNDDKTVNNESTMYGTTVEYNDSIYVKLDGSELLTPVSTTTDIKPGERVIVMVKNHTATVTGNISSPAARTDDVKEIDGKVDNIGNQISEFEIVIADKVSTKDFDAEKARIDNLVVDNVTIKKELTANKANISDLEADNVTINEKLTANEADISKLKTDKLDATLADITYATITELEATNAEIHNLDATFGSFRDLTTDKLTANEASIKDLEVNKLDVESAEIKYANIDFANINEAAIKKLFTDSGIIKDLVVSEGHITGELVGVTIKGDLIEGGTVKADKLVVMGSDGLYYKLNVNGETVESEQTEYNSLDGSVITAKSITATKISVDDLVAFGATIGGFKITSNSIYSGVKSSVDNTTRGIYQDNDGQFYVGDSDNFLKFYKDSSENYKLEISADSMMFGSDKKNVETVINETVNDVKNLDQKTDDNLNSVGERISLAESVISQLSDSISMLITDADGTSLMTQTSTGWQFNISSLQDSLNEASDNIDSLLNTTGDINETVNSLNQAVNDLGAKSEYINIGVYNDEPCIELGESDSDFKLLITNTKIMFQNGSSTPTYINTNGLVTEDIQVNNEILQGGFVWKIHGSGNLGLLWKGETN